MKKVLPYIFLTLVGASCTTYQEIGSSNTTLEQPITKTTNYTEPANLQTATENIEKTSKPESHIGRIEVLSYSVAIANR